MNKEKKAVLQMALCAIMWSTAGILIKLIPWHGMVISGARSLVAAGVFVVYLLITKQKWLLSRRTLSIAVVMCLTYTSFIMANKFTTAANAIVMQYTGPVFILAYGAVVKKQKFHPFDYGVVALTLFGIALFFFDQLTSSNILGNVLGLLAGVGFGATFLVNAGTDNRTRMNGLLQGQLLTALVGLPLAFFNPTPITVPAIAAIVALGVFQLGIPYVLFGLALRFCPALTCSILAALEPLLNPVWVAIFTGEAPGAFALVGGAVVVISITAWCVWDNRRKEAQIAGDATAVAEQTFE